MTSLLFEPIPASRALTFFDNIDNVIGIEAEFVCVLSIIGMQSLALWHTWAWAWARAWVCPRWEAGWWFVSGPCGESGGGWAGPQEEAVALCAGLELEPTLLKFKSSPILEGTVNL